MIQNKKKCAIILPYFGKLHNYFQLFLNSCRKNTDYDWLIFTNDMTEYDYPHNVIRIKFTLAEVKQLAEKKMGISVELSTPYKLCDFKPTYGLIFEEYLVDYAYWGHCDCDLLFGNLNNLLSPILEEGYDKIFAAGHLTIYKNSAINNRRFMNQVDGRAIYQEALQTNKIYVFDEDYQYLSNPNGRNIQDIFIQEKCTIFNRDLSMNISGLRGRFCRAFYDFEKRTFLREKYQPRRYFWNRGEICTYEWNASSQNIEQNEYIYIHLQMRKMKAHTSTRDADIIEVLPDRFVKRKNIPYDKKSMRLWSLGFTYGYWYNELIKKIKNKIKKKK